MFTFRVVLSFCVASSLIILCKVFATICVMYIWSLSLNLFITVSVKLLRLLSSFYVYVCSVGCILGLCLRAAFSHW